MIIIRNTKLWESKQQLLLFTNKRQIKLMSTLARAHRTLAARGHATLNTSFYVK